MQPLVKLLGMFLIATVAWYGAWRFVMEDDVTRIETSITHHNQRFKEVNRQVTLKSDGVRAAGFPFAFHVVIDRLTLSMIEGKETYAVSFPELTLDETDEDQGRYRVTLPPVIEALYAVDGNAPENYRVILDTQPDIAVRAMDDSTRCSPIPGSKPCEAVADDAPIITYALGLPASITVKMELNNESRDVRFDVPQLVRVPLFQTIPKGIDRTLSLAVGVLREALVFKTKTN